jgi:hypothetical protein
MTKSAAGGEGSASPGMFIVRSSDSLRLSRFRMPATPVYFVLPSSCPSCSAKDAAVPLTRVRGTLVELTWLCRVCRHEWRATRDDESGLSVH